MAKYWACEKERVRELVSTLKMKAHLARQRKRFDEIMEAWNRGADKGAE